MVFGHETNPAPDVRKYPFTLNVGETRDFDISGARVLIFAESIAWGTGAGEISIAIGETGDFWDLCPADTIVLSMFTRFKLRNNAITAKSGVLLHSTDPNFRLLNAPRGV